jgi:hypothetical protein
MSFTGKIVVVTGAGSGIGRALAVGFSADGARVLGIGRTRASLEETARLCRGQMDFVVGNVADESHVAALFALAEPGGVDVLINNAASYPKRLFGEMSHREWAEVIETNVLGMALCCRVALPRMLERGSGRIINMGSFAWRNPFPTSSAYAASKAAVTVLTKGIANEVDRARYPDVLVNELAAGQFRTGMSEVGGDPSDAYAHAKTVASLSAGGPHGELFLGSSVHREEGGFRARGRRLMRALLGRS